MSGKADWSFQEDAVNKTSSEFILDPSARKLIVIPTGGGKTITAIRCVNELIERGVLSKEKKAIWATHRKQLKKQTEDVLKNEKNKKRFKLHKDINKILEICMKEEARKILNQDKEDTYKLLIIDEAHHSAANTYKEFFSKKKLGILGLTATPTRTDDCTLEFDDVAYTITFRELMKRNVITLPTFRKINTDVTVYASSLKLDRNPELDKFDTEERNRKIAEDIIKDHKHLHKKIVIFVGSNAHVKNLYEAIHLVNEDYNEPYEHVGYIFGDNNNEKGVTNEAYLKWHKKIKSSILINCKLLNEGYDDPSLDTIIMAVPTRSLLYYMQCVGRVVRNPEEGHGEDVYVVEVCDNLPNIGYRIDNRWLFADISDVLEPKVIDAEFYDLGSFRKNIKKILKEHNVSEGYIKKIEKQISDNKLDLESISLLLYNPLKESSIKQNNGWKPFLITSRNRDTYIPLFNTLSNNISRYYKLNHDYLLFDKFKISRKDEYFKDGSMTTDFFSALKHSYDEIDEKKEVKRLKYISFSLVDTYPQGFLEFIEECHNSAYLKNEFKNISNQTRYVLKFPLMLTGFEGYCANETEFQFCEKFRAILKDIKNTENLATHSTKVFENINGLCDVPLPLKYIKSLVYIVRDDLNYYYEVQGDKNE
ncbi:DEAD/DEAH box helicase [Candidatus Undinarchaeota archaeon]